jgi:cobalamin biosynthesis Co2+ chelatase CbiK
VENRKFDEAEKLMKTVEKSSDNNNKFVINRSFFRLYMAKEDYKNAIRPLKLLAAEENAFHRFLGFCYGKVGDTVNAYKVIEKIKTLDIDEEDGKSHQLAVAFAGIQQKDSVFYYLDTIRNNRSGLLYREMVAFFDFIKDDPRYPELLRAHGIEED